MRGFLHFPPLIVFLILLTGCSSLMTANRQLVRQAYPEAVQSYQEYLDTHPDSIQARIGLGEALIHTNDIQGALGALTQAMPEADQYPEAILFMGLASLKNGDYASALDYLGAFSPPGYGSVVKTIETGQDVFEETLAAHGDGSPEAVAAARIYFSDIYRSVTALRESNRKSSGKISGGGNGGDGGGSGGG